MPDEDPVPTAYRVAGGLMVASGALNLTMAASLLLTLVWVCIGIFWIPALLLSVVEITVGAVILTGKPLRAGRWVALLGAINGLWCLSPMSLALELGAVACQYLEPVNRWLLPHIDEPWD